MPPGAHAARLCGWQWLSCLPFAAGGHAGKEKSKFKNIMPNGARAQGPNRRNCTRWATLRKILFWLDKGGEVRYVLLYGARHVSR
jgi:hypothetical protein